MCKYKDILSHIMLCRHASSFPSTCLCPSASLSLHSTHLSELRTSDPQLQRRTIRLLHRQRLLACMCREAWLVKHDVCHHPRPDASACSALIIHPVDRRSFAPPKLCAGHCCGTRSHGATCTSLSHALARLSPSAPAPSAAGGVPPSQRLARQVTRRRSLAVGSAWAAGRCSSSRQSRRRRGLRAPRWSTRAWCARASRPGAAGGRGSSRG